MQSNKISNRKITTLWSQGNAGAENFMKPLKKCIQTAYIEKKDWQTELHQFLLHYRATPYLTTKVVPTTAIFGRTIRTKLPSIPSTVVDTRELNNDIDNADREAKEKRNTYADRCRCTKEPSFKVDDQVLFRQPKRNKLIPKFDPRPYKITSISGTMITAQRHDKMITRTSSYFKKFTGESNFDSGSESETDGKEVTCRDNPEEIYDQP